MKRNPTVIKKNPNMQSAVNHDTTFSYDPMIENNKNKDMSIDVINQLNKNINHLDKADHEQIYTLLRNHVDSTFFAPNNVGTYFNINNLTNPVKWELYRIVQMIINDSNRKNIIKSALTTHTHTISSLDQTLHEEGGQTLLDQPIMANPSESEKIKRMKIFSMGK